MKWGFFIGGLLILMGEGPALMGPRTAYSSYTQDDFYQDLGEPISDPPSNWFEQDETPVQTSSEPKVVPPNQNTKSPVDSTHRP